MRCSLDARIRVAAFSDVIAKTYGASCFAITAREPGCKHPGYGYTYAGQSNTALFT